MKNDAPFFSVLVLTYEPDPSKLISTLYSIIIQDEPDKEIVISDDGSASFDDGYVRKFFESYGFNEYRIVRNVPNEGTVSNMLKGVSQCRGRYIKPISPGDYLFRESTLSEMRVFLEDSCCAVCFGKAAHYNTDADGEVRILQESFPRDLSVYRARNDRRIARNYLCHRDYILGAAFIVEKELYIQYLHKISGKIKFSEDQSAVLMVSDGIIPMLFDEHIVWYESGTGISSPGKDKWAAILAEENRAVYGLIRSGDNLPETVRRWWAENRNTIGSVIFRMSNRLWWNYTYRTQIPETVSNEKIIILSSIINKGRKQ